MNDAEIIELAQKTLFMAIQISLPPLLVGLLIGLVIALFQALTQIQEITLTFVPKILAVFATIMVLFPAMAETMTGFMQILVDQIVSLN